MFPLAQCGGVTDVSNHNYYKGHYSCPLHAERSSPLRSLEARYVLARQPREQACSIATIHNVFSGRGEVAPRRLRIYANRPNIVDFSEAEDIKPHLNISLLEGETTVAEYPLRAASFANVYSLSLFFVGLYIVFAR